MALLSATTFATQYCQDLLVANDGNHTITLTCEKISDGNYVMTIEGKDLNGFGGTFYNPGTVDLRTKITSQTTTKIVCNIDAASDPVFYTPLYVMMPGEVAFPSNDIEWGSCGGEKETIKPVMGEATLASVNYNSVVLNVAGTDKEAEDGEVVAVTRFKVVYGETTKIYTATDEKITITGLTAGTEYSFSIYAVDAAGNESTNKATVPDVKTLSYPAAPAAPVHAQDKVRSIYSDTYTSALAHDFAKNMWSGIQYEEITLDENNHYLFYTTNVTWIAWGENNDGDNAIIAAEGYNDGTHKGLDLSVMDNLHVDIFVDAECVSGEVTINDDHLAGLGTLEGGKWNSINLSLEGLKSGLTAEKPENKINSTRWIKFVGLNGVSMVIIDNVYAWKNGTSTAVDAQEVATKVSKMIENGQVVIIREGVKYDVTGRAIKR